MTTTTVNDSKLNTEVLILIDSSKAIRRTLRNDVEGDYVLYRGYRVYVVFNAIGQYYKDTNWVK